MRKSSDPKVEALAIQRLCLEKAWQFNVELLCNLAHLRNLRSKSSSAASQCYSRSDDVSVVELVELGFLAGVLLKASNVALRVSSFKLVTNLGRKGEVRRQRGLLLLGFVIGALCEGRGCGQCNYGSCRCSDQGFANRTHQSSLSAV